MSDLQQEYRLICSENSLPIFQQDWWWDAVLGSDNWDAVIVRKEGRLIGAMPYWNSTKLIFNRIRMPYLTKYCGPFVAEDKGFNEVLIHLPNYDELDINYSVEGSHYKDFPPVYSISKKPTYWIRDTSDFDAVESNFSSNVKRSIKKAIDKYNVVVKRDSNSIDAASTIYLDILEKAEIKGISKPLLKRLFEATTERNSGMLIDAENENGYMGSLFLIWDNHKAYYLYGGVLPEFKNTGAFHLLMREAIKVASEKGLIFDFEGSQIESIAKFFKSFGSEKVDYINIHRKASFLYRLVSGG